MKRTLKKVFLTISVIILAVSVTSCSTLTASSYDQSSLLEQEDTTDNSGHLTGDFDEVLASNDNIHIVSSFQESYNSAETVYGVVDSSGEWIYAPNICAINTELPNYWDGKSSVNVNYVGDGIFFISYGAAIIDPSGIIRSDSGGIQFMKANVETWGFYYVVEDNRVFSGPTRSYKNLSSSCYGTTYFMGGIALAYCLDNPNMTNTGIAYEVLPNGSTIPLCTTGFDGFSGPLCDGLFYSDSAFYNISGAVCIDLEDLGIYNVVIPRNEEGYYVLPMFEDGVATIYMENPNGTEYIAKIAKDGTFIDEPTPV